MGKRPVPMLPVMMPVFCNRDGESDLSDGEAALLVAMIAATNGPADWPSNGPR